MGIYINPPDMEKERWLQELGHLIPRPKQHREGDMIVVCLVDNGSFTAAGVAFSQRELEAFTYPDGRSKLWFQVSINDLIEVGAINSPDDIDPEN